MTDGSYPLPVLYNPGLSAGDAAALSAAVAALERQSFVVRLAAMSGQKLALSASAIPERYQKAAVDAAQQALTTAARVALYSLNGPSGARDRDRLHCGLAALSGGVGGAVGLASLPVELPISTTIMLRSIADIARCEGENLSDPAAALACLEVFALGGQSAESNVLEGGYLAMRGLLAKSVSDAARYVATKPLAGGGAPVVVRLIGQIAASFGVTVSQKAAAQAVPVIGALSGAAINFAFTQHYQTLARGHFAVRRLERLYGPQLVQSEYARIARAEGYWRDPRAA